MRDAAIAVMRELAFETRVNVQFAASRRRPHDRDRDEPARLAFLPRWPSKATGFPIAKIAAKLAVGYTLDEIPNAITRKNARLL